jgi:hypothetical protein
MNFIKSGTDIWTSRNNAYTIRKTKTPAGCPSTFLLRDGHGTFLGAFGTKSKAEAAAREDAIVKTR